MHKQLLLLILSTNSQQIFGMANADIPRLVRSDSSMSKTQRDWKLLTLITSWHDNSETFQQKIAELELCISQKANVNYISADNKTMLMRAIESNVPSEVVALLIENGALITDEFYPENHLPINVVETQIKSLQDQLKDLLAQQNPDLKANINDLQARIENLENIGLLVNPAKHAPAVPAAPLAGAAGSGVEAPSANS